ncbi:MAG: DUF4465 domain-containing protein [Muribaculaceae bacterium]|nr:DUF4465 domain-containing protein [Muribaculaceae bacterium]
MKHLHFFAAGAIAALALVTTSCSDSDEPATDMTQTVKFEFDKADFSETGEWEYCYDAAYDNALTVDGLTFSRSALATEWGGVTYYSWKGFTPSVSTDKSNHAGDWVTYQWGAITGQPVAGNGYMLGCWDAQEELTAAPDFTVPSSPSVKIVAKAPFTPAYAYITNACYSYYTMLDGDDFCHKFTSEDWLTLYIHGLRNGDLTSTVEVKLATGTNLLSAWQKVDLSTLGTVDTVYFQMASSDSGQWGMNTPAYFCLGSLALK